MQLAALTAGKFTDSLSHDREFPESGAELNESRANCRHVVFVSKSGYFWANHWNSMGHSLAVFRSRRKVPLLGSPGSWPQINWNTLDPWYSMVDLHVLLLKAWSWSARRASRHFARARRASRHPALEDRPFRSFRSFHLTSYSPIESREFLAMCKAISWLVVWNMAFVFPYLGNGTIIPTDFHSIIFQRGRAQPPSR